MPPRSEFRFAAIFRRKRWRVALCALIPIAGLFLLYRFFPLEGARLLVETKLAAATGQTVTLRALRLSGFGGLRLVGLEFRDPGLIDPNLPLIPGRGEPSPATWLRVDSARIDVGLSELLSGRVEPTRIAVRGAALRVVRDAEGRLLPVPLWNRLLADRSENGGGDRRDAPPPAGEPSGAVLDVAFERLAIIYRDDLLDTDLRVEKLEGEARWDSADRRLQIPLAEGFLNGGTLELSALLDFDPSSPRLEAELRVRDARADLGLASLVAHALPVVAPTLLERAGKPDSEDALVPGLESKLAVLLYAEGRDFHRLPIADAVKAEGRIALDPVSLDSAKPLAALRDYAGVSASVNLGSIESDFLVADRRVRSKALKINFAGVPVVLAGSTTFDGRVDYRIDVERVADKLGPALREWLEDLDLGPEKLARLHLRGDLRSLRFDAESPPEAPSASTPGTPRRKRG